MPTPFRDRTAARRSLGRRLAHVAGRDDVLALAPPRGDVAAALDRPRLERAIGVIYRPETERASHDFPARRSGQFDAMLDFDRTRAVEPPEHTTESEAGEVPETSPSGV